MKKLDKKWDTFLEEVRKRNAKKEELVAKLRSVHKKHAADIKRHILILKASAEALQELDKTIAAECLEMAEGEDCRTIYTCGIQANTADGPDMEDVLENVIALSHVIEKEAEKMAQF
jgi:hypothetical protein